MRFHPSKRPGLRLAVPQSAMAACYPPRAAYKMHLDSYFLQGARGRREGPVDAGCDVPKFILDHRVDEVFPNLRDRMK